MIDVRPAETDEELEAWRQVRLAVMPNEPAATVAEMREMEEPARLLLLAELDGEVAGSGIADRSSTSGHGFVAPRVVPGLRRRGVGAALLHELAAHCAGLGLGRVTGHVEGGDEASLAFAHRFGFEEADRQVEQVIRLAEPLPPSNSLLQGIDVVTIAERPELLGAAYDLGVEGFADMATPWPVTIAEEEWLREQATLPDGSFVALAGEEIVGFAGLCAWPDRPASAVNGLTVVRRAWRRRGLASELKLRQLAWAAANGIDEVVTWTQRGNENMRRVNERLGYVTRSESLTMVAELPL